MRPTDRVQFFAFVAPAVLPLEHMPAEPFAHELREAWFAATRRRVLAAAAERGLDASDIAEVLDVGADEMRAEALAQRRQGVVS